MDRWSGKRAIEVRPDSKKRVGGFVLEDRFISNIYSVEKKPMKFTRFVGSSDKKDKSVLSSSRSLSNGKEVTGTSSNIYGSSSSSVKCEKQPLSQISMDSSESSRGSEDELETETLELTRGRDKQRAAPSEMESSNCHQAQESREFHHPDPSGQSTTANRGCSPLLSGVISSGFGLEKRLSRKVDTFNKRKVYGESSSSSSGSGKKITELPSEERHLVFNPRGSVSDSRRARQCVLNVDNDVASVERSVNRRNSRIRFSNRGSGSRNGLSSITTTEMSQTETSNNLNSPVSLELFSGFPKFGLSGYNLDGISEILPKLDRIEQDIELNYEELLIMETGLLLGGLRFYDQHRDMRLDIDNMSYEELLALEERIGTVSTALTEEAISKSLKTSIYQKKPSSYGSVTNSPCDHKEDAKCSICQEEYTIGDEVGRLHCEHTYNLKCVQEWLRMKSWCPICKTTAKTSFSK
ncbi:hypothetical protein Bca52824_094335 [Brassica carinata]|uniref:RING-type E3 ubiquitin transferase n=1 Tax=Brassica carinata TaxID=52824 RepID=A0A8X7P2I9_BRACI|nr:hypothetical protein Bca52824_094335 [Brassica carinata]